MENIQNLTGLPVLAELKISNSNYVTQNRPVRWGVKNWFSENCILLFIWLLRFIKKNAISFHILNFLKGFCIEISPFGRNDKVVVHWFRERESGRRAPAFPFPTWHSWALSFRWSI